MKAAGNEPRFEFRVWTDRPDDASDQIHVISESAEIRDSIETYFVSTSATEANPKARADLLDIKTLVDVREDFERWEVHLKARFPIEAAVVANELFPLMGIVAPHLEREIFTLPQLVAEVVGPSRDVSAVEVTKRRTLHTIGPCLAEITHATIVGNDLWTVAIESTNLDALVEIRNTLGLDGQRNVSYPLAIRQALGGRYADADREGVRE